MLVNILKTERLYISIQWYKQQDYNSKPMFKFEVYNIIRKYHKFEFWWLHFYFNFLWTTRIPS